MPKMLHTPGFFAVRACALIGDVCGCVWVGRGLDGWMRIQ